MRRQKASIDHVVLDCGWRNQRRLTVSSRTGKDTGVCMNEYAHSRALPTEGPTKTASHAFGCYNMQTLKHTPRLPNNKQAELEPDLPSISKPSTFSP